jgi:MoaA/NifB/PqqE/SkfB family radical SAM enzyme
MEADRSFRALVERTWSENLLFSVLVELTYRCNLDCFFCYNDLGLRGAPLSTERYLSFFRELRELEVLNLTLSGGEPLAHPDFLLLGRAARELGFVVRVKSNGHALHGTLARRLREEVDPFQVEVSLHGATAATHDRQTRVPGSFERLRRNLEEMLALGLRVKLNSTLTRWNEDEIEGMYALADALGLRLQVDPEVTPRDDGDRQPLQVAPSREGVLRLFRLDFERGEAAARAAGLPAPAAPAPRSNDELMPAAGPKKHCGAGSSGIAVDPYGNVYPCVQWRRPVGNLHRQTLREIWFGSRDLDEIRRLTERVKETVQASGPGAGLLNFCPGLAAASSGDPLAIYAGAEQRRDLLQQVERERGARALLPVLP